MSEMMKRDFESQEGPMGVKTPRAVEYARKKAQKSLPAADEVHLLRRAEGFVRRIPSDVGSRGARADGDEDSSDGAEYVAVFSTEAPVDRSWGIEVLDHSPASVRLERIQNAGVMHLDHRTDVQNSIGGITAAWTANGRGIALIRPSKRDEVRGYWDDVDSGVLGSVSVGYMVHKAERDSELDGADGKPGFRILDWEPYEISLTSVPADVNATVKGRSLSGSSAGRSERRGSDGAVATESGQRPVEPRFANVIKEKAGDEGVREDSSESVSGLAQASERIACANDASQILALAQYIHSRDQNSGVLEMADDYVMFGKDFDSFKKEAWNRHMQQRRANSPTAVVEHPANLGMSAGDIRNYSLFKAIRASLSGNWRDAGLELEASRSISTRTKKEPRGFFVPLDVQRVMTAGGAGTGAELVPADHRGDLFIDALRTESVVLGMGATLLPNLQGDLPIPKLIGSADFYWVAEDADVPDSDGGTGTVNLTPKTIGGAVPMSRRLLIQSDPSVEGMMMNDLVLGVALALDLAALEGTGASNQPLGVSGQADVTPVTIATPGQPTWGELVQFETALDSADALGGELAYITTPAIVGHCKTTPKDAGSGIFLMQGTEINGYPARRRTGLSANAIYFGNIRDILIATWGILDVRADEATKAASGGLVLRVFLDADIAVRHGQSFSKNTGP